MMKNGIEVFNPKMTVGRGKKKKKKKIEPLQDSQNHEVKMEKRNRRAILVAQKKTVARLKA